MEQAPQAIQQISQVIEAVDYLQKKYPSIGSEEAFQLISNSFWAETIQGLIASTLTKYKKCKRADPEAPPVIQCLWEVIEIMDYMQKKYPGQDGLEIFRDMKYTQDQWKGKGKTRR